MTNISFDFGQEQQVGLDPFYLSSKGSNCRGVAHASTVPPEDPHGAGGGMIRPASLAIELEVEREMVIEEIDRGRKVGDISY